jgi:hypothetical protein
MKFGKEAFEPQGKAMVAELNTKEENEVLVHSSAPVC